jgi:hypothetical protein
VESWVPWDWSTIKLKIGSIKCEACGRLFGEHSGDEFEACQRACNPPQNIEFDLPDDRFVGDEPDPVKRAKRRAEVLEHPCPECGRTFGAHSGEELKKCSGKYRDSLK